MHMNMMQYIYLYQYTRYLSGGNLPLLMEGITLSILPIIFYNFFMKIKGKEYNKKLNIGLIIIAIVLFAFSIIMKKYDEYIIAPVSFKVFYKSLVQLTICAILGIYYSFFYNKLNKVAVGVLTILVGIILEVFFSGNEIMNNFADLLLFLMIFVGIIIIMEKLVLFTEKSERKNVVINVFAEIALFIVCTMIASAVFHEYILFEILIILFYIYDLIMLNKSIKKYGLGEKKRMAICIFSIVVLIILIVGYLMLLRFGVWEK